MVDTPTDDIAKALEATNQLVSGNLSVIAALVSALERRNPNFKQDFIKEIETLLDGMSSEEREAPISLPLRCLWDFLQNPDEEIPRLLH